MKRNRTKNGWNADGTRTQKERFRVRNDISNAQEISFLEILQVLVIQYVDFCINFKCVLPVKTTNTSTTSTNTPRPNTTVSSVTTIISTNTSLITTSRISTSQIITDIKTTDLSLTKNSDNTTIPKSTSAITTTDIKTSEPSITESTNSQITTDNFKSTNLNSSSISTELTSLKTESAFNYWKFIIFDIMNPTPTFTFLMSILATDSTSLQGCLINCSNHGQCKLNINSFIYECGCDPYFSGSYCQYDSSPCSSSPCLNNGTCTNSKNDTSFQCECQNTFFGLNCESQINICENKTCNQHGYCYNTLNVPKCKCLIGYSGDDCESASIFNKIVRPSVQILATLICIIVIIATIIFVVSNDFLNYYYTIKIRNKLREPQVDKKFWIVKLK